MAPIQRVLAIDLGNHYTGVAIVDMRPPSFFEIVHVECIVDTSKTKDNVLDRLEEVIDPLIKVPLRVVVVYENNVFGGDNWDLMRLQKRVRKHYEEMGLFVKALLPSQKVSMLVGLNNRERKIRAVKMARRLLQEVGAFEQTFDQMERNHDVADALLMARYVFESGVVPPHDAC